MATKEGNTRTPKEKCEYCGRDEHRFADPPGDCVGSSDTLGKNISDRESHPWQIRSHFNGKNTIQPHHLITSQVIKEGVTPKGIDYGKICIDFGWDVNNKQNGVWLPSEMKLACQLGVPLHRANHSSTEGSPGLNYVASIRKRIKTTFDSASTGGFCKGNKADVKGFRKEMKTHSRFVFHKIKDFRWTLTSDGRNYHPASRVGCGNKDRIPEKGRDPSNCSAGQTGRDHGIPVRPHTLALGT